MDTNSKTKQQVKRFSVSTIPYGFEDLVGII